jgi:phosphoadenosine phosphosulfate reductase
MSHFEQEPRVQGSVLDHASALRFNEEPPEQGPEALVRWARRTFGEDIIMTSSFGGESALMLHLVSSILPSIRVVFIDTGYLFPETYRFVETLTRRFSLDVRVYSPALTAARLEALHGQLWKGDQAALEQYGYVTKVEPMQRALAELRPKAWFAGLRRSQTQHRSRMEYVQPQGQHYKVCPILDFTDDDVRRYLNAHGLPYHPLYEQGYRSIGDTHSTRPTLNGQDARDGRLLGRGGECGLHTMLADEVRASASHLAPNSGGSIGAAE